MDSRDESVGIATSYGVGSRCSIPDRDKYFLLCSVDTSFEAHQVSRPMDTAGPFLGGKAATARSWTLTSLRFRGQEWLSYICIPPYVFMVW
jgi:hypothetical protein